MVVGKKSVSVLCDHLFYGSLKMANDFSFFAITQLNEEVLHNIAL